MTMRPCLPVLKISRMGEAAFLCDAATSLDLALQRRIWAMAEVVERWPQVQEVVPGVNNLLVVFDPAAKGIEGLEQALHDAWPRAEGHGSPGRLIEVPVDYGGALGQDLGDLASHAGLSPADYVLRHSAAEYRVLAIGAVPGFPYLAGLDPMLGKKRRDVPRHRVEAGSVIIGGVQAGILPVTSPSGWHIIGRTSLSLFDASASPPIPLAPGDRLRFVVQSVQP